MTRTFILAEAGANHDKKWDKCCQLVRVAKNAGADAVKFQLYSSELLYSKNTPDFAGYKNIPKLIKEIEFPREWHQDLKKFCDDLDIEFVSSPFDEKSIDELYNLGVKRLKIASFEASDPRIIKHASETQLPLIISLGVGCRGEFGINEIINWVCEKNKNPDLTFLHCVSAYPTKLEDVRLGQLDFYIRNTPYYKARNIKFGFSDHTMSTLTPAIAVYNGAEVIEKHFTLNRNDKGPDHPFSLEPNELIQMVGNIRDVEILRDNKYRIGAITSGEKEKEMIKATRSVVAKRNIQKGEIFSQENLTTKRPFLENAISAKMFFQVFGKKALRDIFEDDIILNDMVEL